jgi:helix-turn-helix protein
MREEAPMRAKTSPAAPEQQAILPVLRFDVPEAAAILRMSRAQLYVRIQEGALRIQKDGARTYISRTELERYVTAREPS